MKIEINDLGILIILLLTSLIMVGCDKSTFGIKNPAFKVEDNGENKYKIEIEAGTNAAIFYTTDGSAPGVDDRRYTQEIEVEKGTEVRAIAICPSGRKSAVTEVKP